MTLRHWIARRVKEMLLGYYVLMNTPPVIQYCQSCQKKLPSGASFCASCGKSPTQSSAPSKSPLIIGAAGIILVSIAIALMLNNRLVNPNKQSVLVGATATRSTPEPTPMPIPWPEDATPIVRTTLDEFGRRYDDNKIFVKTTYGGKFVAIQGQVKSINGDLGSGELLLRAMGTNAAITCHFNSRTTGQLARVRKGLVVVVCGYFDGGEGQPLASDKLEMRDCKIENAEGSQAQTQAISPVSGTLFNARPLLGARESDLEAVLGVRTQRTESFATYKPAGCEEVTVRITEGRVASLMVYFSTRADTPQEALQKVGIYPPGPPERTAPQAAIWSGSSLGMNVPEVSAFLDAGSVGGWDCVGIK